VESKHYLRAGKNLPRRIKKAKTSSYFWFVAGYDWKAGNVKQVEQRD